MFIILCNRAIGNPNSYKQEVTRTNKTSETDNFIKQKVEVTFYDPKTATKELVEKCVQQYDDLSPLVEPGGYTDFTGTRWAKEDLPEIIWNRPKMGFSFPFQQWLKNSSV